MSFATAALKGVYEIGKGIVGYTLYEKATDYVFDKVPSAPANKPEYTGQPPTSKPQTSNTTKTNTKGQKAVALGSLLVGALGTYEQVLGDAKSTATSLQSTFESTSQNNQTKTQELLTPSLASPLLSNQVFTKASIDSIVDALNANTLMSSVLFSTLDVNLSNIASSLYAISSTLLTISNDYKEDVSNTGDVPYINPDDYYKMLSKSGLSDDQINQLQDEEKIYVQSLKNAGYGYADIKKFVVDWRSKTVPSSGQDYVSDTVAGVGRDGSLGSYTPVTRSTSSGELVNELVPNSGASVPTFDLKVPNLEKWAESAFNIQNAIGIDTYSREINARMVKNEFAINETVIRDLDGNELANVRPMEAHAIKSMTEARLRTDMNNITHSDDDIDLSLNSDLDLSRLFVFLKKSDRLQEVFDSLGYTEAPLPSGGV